jgi:hypothetical protein
MNSSSRQPMVGEDPASYNRTDPKIMNGITKLMALAAASAALGLVQNATAGVVAVNIGTGSPPATLGTYAMTELGSLPPGSITGDDYVASIGSGWATWGQGYTGQVFVIGDYTQSVPLILDLSAGTEAVDFYAEPNVFNTFNITATDSSGATITEAVNGDAGSAGFGFYESGAGSLSSITVTADVAAEGFAIGEFGVNGGTITGGAGAVPDATGTMLLLGIALGGIIVLSQRRQASLR